jgi:hypothetical protein
MYLKRSKLNILRRKPTRDVFQNMHWEPRDASRYDEPSTVPHHVRIETAIACIYDTLHFKSQKWLIDLFTQNPVLDTVYATMVLPVEAVYRHRSLEPSLYTLTYNYDGYQYLPGGHAGGSYHHEFATFRGCKQVTFPTKVTAPMDCASRHNFLSPSALTTCSSLNAGECSHLV